MISREAHFERDSSLLVARGLYVLRYEFGGPSADPAVALVSPAPGFETVIQVMSAPGAVDGWLERPGAAVLVRAVDNGKIQIKVRRGAANGSLDAAFRLELVSVPPEDHRGPDSPAGLERRAPSPASVAGPPSAAGSQDAMFLAHVSRRGDVTVRANEWAGGPDAPGRIEGLAILSLGRDDVQAEIQVLAGSRSAAWSPWIGEGAFAGTRGQSLPLLGVRLRLIGERAQHFIAHAEALFLGSPIVSHRGRDVELVSATGRDPLVGIRFELCPERRASVRPTVHPVGHDDIPRVRIFRANAG